MTSNSSAIIATGASNFEGAHAAREKVISQLRFLIRKGSDPLSTQREEYNAMLELMDTAGQPITYVETREIWNNMCATNNGSFPLLEDVVFELSRKCLRKISEDSNQLELKCNSMNDSTYESSDEEEVKKSEIDDAESLKQEISILSDLKLFHFIKELAICIKDTYSIRKREDNSEFWFIVSSISFLWITVGAIAVAGYYHGETNPKIGIFTRITLRSILVESFILFAVELIWECILSWIVLRYNIKVNYTRKLGNLLKVPKYFVADFFPNFTSTALSMTTALAVNQTLFCAMYYRRSRERVPFFSYVFLSQDRREDRPDTLIFQVTEDILRFAIYFPFKLLVVDLIQSPAIIFIPIAVNNIGDGLAEPVGVAFGKHKYSTTAIFYSEYLSCGSLAVSQP